MDPQAPSECRKSLDQLLEQALAERSREEEQVEVTYELTSDFVPEQRGYRLNPEDAAAAISSRNKDEEEDENEGCESLVDDPRPGQANRIIAADLIDKVDDLVRSDQNVTLRMLAVKVDVSIGTVWTIVHDRLRYRKVCARGFSALQSLQSSIFPAIGLQSLSILYFFATFSCICGPIIDHKIGIKWTFFIVSSLEALYVLAFHYYHPFALITCAIFLGLGLGPMIRVQKSYLSRNISRLSYVTQAMRNKIQQRYLRIFFLTSKSFYFWGNLAAAIIMEYAGGMYSESSSLSNSTEDAVTVIQHTELCYERLCKNGIYPVESDPEDVIESTTTVPSKATKIFIYVFTPAIAIGVLIIFIFLEKVEALLEQDPMERSLFHQTMRQMRLILVDKNVRLALPMLIFIGIEQAFIVGDFTRAYISCALGLQSVSFTMMCLGGAHTLGSFGVLSFLSTSKDQS
ncbi:UNC93-like protein like [Argiope bruennichi]|uniref:UNC93-like protein like n=1 Tax=Argiope bruennichi TaxID=94029 RepID=A0A8T0FML0_ARGBR|nr:UNC93-like protein like [Argiope bruennichi]